MKMSITRVIDPLSIEIPKKPPNKSASEHRRATKPIMEKRRRARINNCLEQIKSLILKALKKDPAKHAKLEKADILEMTVEYLKGMIQVQSIDKSSVMKSLKAGFDECASEVDRFVNIAPEMDLAMKRRLKSHIKNNFSSLTIANNINNLNNLVTSTTSSTSSSSSSTGPSSPLFSPLNMKTEPKSPSTDHRDALTNISFNYNTNSITTHNDNNDNNNNNNRSTSHIELTTPPPSANSSNKAFRFSPVSFNYNNQYINHQQSNYLISPISPVSHLDDGIDCTPVDCSKSSKLNLEDNVWRPW